MDLLVKVFGILVIVFLFSSCGNNSKGYTFCEYTYNIESGYLTKTSSYSVDQMSDNTLETWRYHSDKDSFEFRFYKENITESSYKTLNNVYTLNFIDSLEIILENQNTSIYKFRFSSASLDGIKTIFFSRKYGVLLYRNDAWMYWKERCSKKDEVLNSIISIIKAHREFFYEKLRVPEPPDIDSL